MVFLLTGIGLLAAIIGLFWLKDHRQSIRLARIAHSELIARFAVLGAALTVIGLLLVLSRLIDG